MTTATIPPHANTLNADMPGEEWRPIAGYEGLYEVSSIGRIRRATDRAIQKLFGNQTTGTRVHLRRGSDDDIELVYRLVARAFLPRSDGRPWVNHKDFDRTNSRLDNLEWVSRRENIHHSMRADRLARTLTPADVRAIVSALADGVKGSVLAKQFGVSQAHISRLKLGKSWERISVDSKAAAPLRAMRAKKLARAALAPDPDLPKVRELVRAPSSPVSPRVAEEQTEPLWCNSRYDSLPGEEWRPIGGFADAYEVSNLGRVRSLDRYVPTYQGQRISRGRVLCQKTPRHGYKTVVLSHDSSYENFLVHRLVAAAFIAAEPGAGTVHHRDFDKSNNRAMNLEWCSTRDNIHHSGSAGRMRHRLNPELVRYIRRRAAQGETQRRIAESLGIGHSTVGAVVTGVCWAHVK